jgi:hypothetical protein
MKKKKKCKDGYKCYCDSDNTCFYDDEDEEEDEE